MGNRSLQPYAHLPPSHIPMLVVHVGPMVHADLHNWYPLMFMQQRRTSRKNAINSPCQLHDMHKPYFINFNLRFAHNMIKTHTISLKAKPSCQIKNCSASVAFLKCVHHAYRQMQMMLSAMGAPLWWILAGGTAKYCLHLLEAPSAQKQGVFTAGTGNFLFVDIFCSVGANDSKFVSFCLCLNSHIWE